MFTKRISDRYGSPTHVGGPWLDRYWTSRNGARSTSASAAGLVETLGTAGPFTVFAPENSAFKKLPADTVDTLLKPENKDKLTKVLLGHVLSANATSAAAIKMIKDDGGEHHVTTVSGDALTLRMKGDKLTILDESGNVATVTQADVSNRFRAHCKVS